MLDGTIVGLRRPDLDELWKINVGTGFVAPPMTYSVGGKQYIAIGLRIGPGRQGPKIAPFAGSSRARPTRTMLFVFGL